MSSNADDVAGDMRLWGTGTGRRVHQVVVVWTAELERRVKRNASGRPGPNAPTGNYRRSITRRTTRHSTGSEGQVGTNAPQGRRLELSFRGTDSLGRRYNQPAYPHFGPGLDSVQGGFADAVADAAAPDRGDQ